VASDSGGDPAVVTRLDALAARRWAVLARALFASRRAEIDALNVFPVPDGDTGTNLYLTLDAALDAVRTADEARPPAAPAADGTELARDAEAFARELLLAARGNSGVILSQIFRGFADEVAATGAPALDGTGLASALRRADALAWASVTRPVEGTILSVSRAAASAGEPARNTLYAVTAAALEAARAALAATPSQLPALERAGVVDAGGAGYVVLLEALERVVGGDLGGEPLAGEVPARLRTGWTQPVPKQAARGSDLRPDGPAYEVMYLLADATADTVARLRRELDALGDSLLVVGSGDLWNVHVHVDDVGAAVEAGIVAGRPHRIRVTHLHDQVRPDRDTTAVAVVVCAGGDGLASVFRGAGAHVVMSGPRRRASTGQLLEAARATGAASVLLLPNDGDTVLAANAAAKVAADEGLDIHVVPARTAVQGIAALAVYDPERDLGENALAMSSAAAATRNGAVTVATTQALTSAGWCHEDDVLGIVDGDVAVIGTDLDQVGGEVVERLLASGGELLTVVSGEDAPPKLGQSVAASARIRRRHLEVTQLYGGQPVYPLMLGVE
jgi:DAK2 domain fusion protein YloV